LHKVTINIVAEGTSTESCSQNIGICVENTDNSAIFLMLFCKLLLSAKWVNN